MTAIANRSKPLSKRHLDEDRPLGRGAVPFDWPTAAATARSRRTSASCAPVTEDVGRAMKSSRLESRVVRRPGSAPGSWTRLQERQALPQKGPVSPTGQRGQLSGRVWRKNAAVLSEQHWLTAHHGCSPCPARISRRDPEKTPLRHYYAMTVKIWVLSPIVRPTEACLVARARDQPRDTGTRSAFARWSTN